jgi:hypothetical protein
MFTTCLRQFKSCNRYVLHLHYVIPVRHAEDESALCTILSHHIIDSVRSQQKEKLFKQNQNEAKQS